MLYDQQNNEHRGTKRKSQEDDSVDEAEAFKSKHSRISKAKWTPEEDEILTRAVLTSRDGDWKTIAQVLSDRSHLQCLHRWQKVLNPALVKGPWREEEDAKLLELVEKHGPKDWSVIATHIPGRIGKQCRERWFNHLSPDVRKVNWSPEEDRIIIDAHSRLGNKWTAISKLLDGRPANAIKNHWNSTLLKKIQEDNGHDTSARNSSEWRNSSSAVPPFKAVLATDDDDDDEDVPESSDASSPETAAHPISPALPAVRCPLPKPHALQPSGYMPQAQLHVQASAAPPTAQQQQHIHRLQQQLEQHMLLQRQIQEQIQQRQQQLSYPGPYADQAYNWDWQHQQQHGLQNHNPPMLAQSNASSAVAVAPEHPLSSPSPVYNQTLFSPTQAPTELQYFNQDGSPLYELHSSASSSLEDLHKPKEQGGNYANVDPNIFPLQLDL